ncbi:transketolase [Steroidobacter sp.]|uniref:transketolase n=1 Tax=Steroidobacter sp. TaxID=1978227 RepID=UPI001A63696A|nr:transketolase [Steroidobacter sp.]MBL8266274.1 transketolase [Steroidobacter sp.]
MSAELDVPKSRKRFEQRRDSVNVLRVLAMDAVQKANSGHPGMPMGMAEIAHVLWQRHLRHNPANPQWFNRDRFVLSNGHGSMLLYSLLHLTGYDLPLPQLQRFRQLHSRTPGHPEYGITPGVETTTGPLGQGIANAVGMAIAEKALAAQFNRPGHEIVDHRTYVFVGDGCMMEGISHEACSLAGTLGLGKLIAFYDDNGISIDGPVAGWFTDDTPRRFASYGWHVVPDVDGHDSDAIDNAIRAAQAVVDKPSLICCKTVIAHGSPNKANTHDSHGAPLGEKEIAATRAALGWSHAPFEIPKDIYEEWDARQEGATAEDAWRRKLAGYVTSHPQLGKELERRMRGDLPPEFAENMRRLMARTHAKAATMATRKASQEAIEGIGLQLPELIGGSADLASSNLTLWSGSRAVTSTTGGNYIYYGVREFGMAAVMNGLALHGGFIPYGGTFLTFSDYCRNALRMAALMQIRSIFVFTHDSIGLGEDGPTHQPIEHVATLRLIPNMDVWRPCDTVETLAAWAAAVERSEGPTSLVLSRQNLAFQDRDLNEIDNVRRGGYVLVEPAGQPLAVIIATGSEVALAVEAQKALALEGVPVRVVSMPSTNVFDRQDAAYRDGVLPPQLPSVAVEAGVTDIWRKYVGRSGAVLGIDRFGESAPAADLMRYFEFVPERVVAAVKALLEREAGRAS